MDFEPNKATCCSILQSSHRLVQNKFQDFFGIFQDSKSIFQDRRSPQECVNIDKQQLVTLYIRAWQQDTYCNVHHGHM